ncbi:MAG: hypothetical protein ACK58L_09160 [Planctomycetota bacterium]
MPGFRKVLNKEASGVIGPGASRHRPHATYPPKAWQSSVSHGCRIFSLDLSAKPIIAAVITDGGMHADSRQRGLD